MLKKVSLFFIFMVLSFFAITACTTKPTDDNKPAEQEITHEVTFFVDSLQFGEKVTVKDGKAVAKPADPVKEEDDANTYEFQYWHLAGERQAYDFSKPIKENTKLYASFIAHAKEYDFVAYIWQGDLENTYITDAEVASIKAAIMACDALAGQRVLVYPVKGKTRNAFVNEALTFGKVDIAFGGANLSPKEKVEGTEYLDIDTTESENPGHLVKMAEGWVANTTRYLGVLNTSAHKENALAVYAIFTQQGPDYATLDKVSVTLKPNEEVQVGVANTEKEVVWSTSDSSIATVEAGLIKGVSDGSCTVFATVGAVSYKVNVTVDAKDYGLVVWVNGMSDSRITAEESELMRSYVEKLLPEGKYLKWEYFSIAEKDFVLQAQSAEIDMVISSSNLGGASSFGDDRKVTFAAEGPKTRLGGIAQNNGWVENTSRYVGIASQVDPEHLANAVNAFALLTHVGPNHIITTNMTEVVLQVEGQETFVVSAFGDVEFASSNEEYLTIDENGLMTALKATVENSPIIVTATDANNNKVQISVTITAAPIVPTYDLYVWINLRTDKDWMSNEDLARLVELAKVEGKKVKVEVRTESKVANLVSAQAAQPANERVDVVIGREALGTSANTYVNDIAAGTVKQYEFDASWGYDTGYIYVMSDVDSTHTDLVNNFVTMVRGKVPGYFELTKTLNLKLGVDAYTFAPVVGEEPATGVSYQSSDESVLTVDESGAITLKAVGEAFVIASREHYSVKVKVTVTAPEAVPYTLVIYINANLNKADIMTRYESQKDVNCTIIFVEGKKTKVADCSAEVIAYDTEHPTQMINIIIGHTQMTSGNANGLVNETNGYEIYETRYNIDSALVTGSATNYYMAITKATTGDAYAEACKIGSLLVQQSE